MKLYLSGAITNDPNYKTKFAYYEEILSRMGHTVMNPAILPAGFTWTEYMAIALTMQSVCDATFFIPDWQESTGAKAEHADARVRFYRLEEIPCTP